MIRKLVVAGTSLSVTDHKGNTPLHIVCKFTSTKCLDEILRYTQLKKVAEIANIRNNDGLTCVHIAAMHSNRETLRKLKTVGVNMDIQVSALSMIWVVCVQMLVAFTQAFLPFPSVLVL